ncbi:MAG TPA: pepsin/retropepsin-like aspartic protease family protein [Candidatus Baltobacteraceae bacterium]|nr:pepsin/retropepsin-like aspartic protease family protein [Candidatus Baltobacteraceae bacterium]
MGLLLSIGAGSVPVRADTELQNVLAARMSAMKALHVREPRTLEVTGSIAGAGLQGAFHSWSGPQGQRYDQWIGTRFESSIRVGGRQFAIDENGNVRELQGLMQQRQRTEDFINEDGFVTHPEDDRYLGHVTLPDGRSAYALQVTPPGGLAETIALDTHSLLIDRISYDDGDGVSTSDYYDYKVFSGALLAQREIDSNGDHDYDLERISERIGVNRPMERGVFAIPVNAEVQTAQPVTVPLEEHDRHYYTHVRIRGHAYTFLVDTGAQAVVIDSHLASVLGLQPQGHLEVVGASRVGGMGVAPLTDSIFIGAAKLPVHVVTILDLHNVTGSFQADGVLGYPFFASAEVRLDAAKHAMTFGKPGSLRPSGEGFPIDVDRQQIELHGKVDGIPGRFVLDTGNSGELLLFSPFMKLHPELLPVGQRQFANSYGVGGSAQALFAMVDELDFGSYRFFNRYANLMLSQQGAFADRFDAGNIGMGVMQNLVVTFDVANAKMYAAQSTAYDDGRFRTRTEPVTPP